MAERKLRQGDVGNDVTHLHGLLNAKLRPSPNLPMMGSFTPATKMAVERFQDANWLARDGVVGPCVWAALEGREKYVILNPVVLVPQWTDTTCWAAALSMLLGRSPAQLAPVGVADAGGMFNDAELSRPEGTARFAEMHGLTLLHAQSWTASGLAGLLRGGPLMMNLLWNAPSYAAGKGSPGHMMIIAGIRGDGTDDGSTIRIYDPWPPNRGSIYSLSYGPFMHKMPVSTYQLYRQ